MYCNCAFRRSKNNTFYYYMFYSATRNVIKPFTLAQLHVCILFKIIIKKRHLIFHNHYIIMVFLLFVSNPFRISMAYCHSPCSCSIQSIFPREIACQNWCPYWINACKHHINRQVFFFKPFLLFFFFYYKLLFLLFIDVFRIYNFQACGTCTKCVCIIHKLLVYGA